MPNHPHRDFMARRRAQKRRQWLRTRPIIDNTFSMSPATYGILTADALSGSKPPPSLPI